MTKIVKIKYLPKLSKSDLMVAPVWPVVLVQLAQASKEEEMQFEIEN